MESIIGRRIDYNGVGALRGQRHIPSKIDPEYSPNSPEHLCINQFQRCPSPPPPPGGNHGAFAHIVSPGGGAFAVLSRSQGLGISVPWGDSRAFDTPVFEGRMGLSGTTRPLSKTGLFLRDQKNLSMFLKVCFLNFRHFFITCKHINISDKVNYILFITKQSLSADVNTA